MLLSNYKKWLSSGEGKREIDSWGVLWKLQHPLCPGKLNREVVSPPPLQTAEQRLIAPALFTAVSQTYSARGQGGGEVVDFEFSFLLLARWSREKSYGSSPTPHKPTSFSPSLDWSSLFFPSSAPFHWYPCLLVLKLPSFNFIVS
jgi:hypothetical protein